MELTETKQVELLTKILTALGPVYQSSLQDLDLTKDDTLLERISTKIVSILDLIEIPGEQELREQREEVIKLTKEKIERLKEFKDGK